MKLISSIKELTRAEQQNLSCGMLASRPAWYNIYEHYFPEAKHVVYMGEENEPIKLVPHFLVNSPCKFTTHNIFDVLTGCLWGQQLADDIVVKEIYPISVSMSPFSFCYGLCGNSEKNTRLSVSDVEQVEKIAWSSNSKIIVYLFLMESEQLETLKKCKYEIIPVGLRWEFYPDEYSSFEQWLKSFPRKRKFAIKGEIKKAKEKGVKIVKWDFNEIVNRQDEMFELYKIHMAKHGLDIHADGGVRNFFPDIIYELKNRLFAFAAYVQDELVGYTMCIEADDVTHVKYAAYKPEKNTAYFLATYYDPIKYAIAHNKILNLSVRSNDIKKRRGLKPRILYLAIKDPMNYLSQLEKIKRAHILAVKNFTTNSEV